jgi:hypothetical protein
MLGLLIPTLKGYCVMPRLIEYNGEGAALNDFVDIDHVVEQSVVV